jgi:5-methylcytosine-specific restriction endonuclease McrA
VKRRTTETYIKYGEECNRGHENPECYTSSGECRQCCLLRAKGSLPSKLELPFRRRAATYVKHGRVCRRGHVDPECYVSTQECVICAGLRTRGGLLPVKLITARQRARNEGRKVYVGEMCVAGHRLRHISNASCVECMRSYELSDRQRRRKLDTNREYLREHPWIGKKGQAKRQQATPLWLTKDQWLQIGWFYDQAAWLSERRGIPHEVDHIVPLRGKTVCGLNVPWNLQIMTKEGNRRKRDRLPGSGELVHLAAKGYCGQLVRA